MKKTKKMKAGALYLFKSSACSNTVYFEELDHAKVFLDLAQQHFKGFLYIHEYMLTKDGWLILARLKSKKDILQAYTTKCKKYNNLPKELPIWKIISEQVRLFIANYVTKYNASTKREGGLVRRPYERYYFDTVQEAMKMIKRIRRRVVGLEQGKKMYRAKKGHYRIPKKQGKGAIYLSSKRRKKKDGRLQDLIDLSVFQRLRTKLLAKKLSPLVKHTKYAHNTPIPDF